METEWKCESCGVFHDLDETMQHNDLPGFPSDVVLCWKCEAMIRRDMVNDLRAQLAAERSANDAGVAQVESLQEHLAAERTRAQQAEADADAIMRDKTALECAYNTDANLRKQAEQRVKDLEAENHQYAGRLFRAARWFAEYAAMHRVKGKEEKARVNQERADFCTAALHPAPSRPAPAPCSKCGGKKSIFVLRGHDAMCFDTCPHCNGTGHEPGE